MVDLSKLTSKQIRAERTIIEPICIFKIGPILTPKESLNWGYSLSKLTNTKHKDLLLRLAHGELYSKERLHRYGLTTDDKCLRCGNTESLIHKYLECPYVQEIWKHVLRLTETSREHSVTNEELHDRIFCIKQPNSLSLTIHAEIINRIRSFKDEVPTMLTMPKLIARLALESLIKKEANSGIKNGLINLLD